MQFTATTVTAKIPPPDPVVEHVGGLPANVPAPSAATAARLAPEPTTSSSAAVVTTTVQTPATFPSVQRVDTATKPTTTTTATAATSTTTTTDKPPAEDEDYSFESMFSFLFNGDAPAEPRPPSSTPSPGPSDNNRVRVTAAETRIEHRADGEIDDKSRTADSDRHPPSHDKRHEIAGPHAQGSVLKSAEPPNSETDGDGPTSAGGQPNAEAEVNTRFDVNENAEFSDYNDNNERPDAPPSSSRHPQTEVNTRFDVRDERRPGVGPHRQSDPDAVPSAADNTYTAHSGHVSHVGHEKESAGSHPAGVDDGNRAGIEPPRPADRQPDRQQQSQPAAGTKAHGSSAKPSKTKVDSEFNPVLASLLKISGCNIYGRMYRVGKIIAELSNPCLECMCTEIGVHCNQLKC